jgi:FkbM family methyltransferase
MSNFINSLTKTLRLARLALTPSGMRIVTRLEDGLIITGLNTKGYGGRGIYISRETIEPEFNFLNQFIDAGDVFIDVGANTGIYTLKAAKRTGENGVVISLEPFPEMLGEIAHNVKINRFNNVRLRGLCAAGNTGPDAFWTNFSMPNSFSLLKRDENAVSFSVLKVRLDDLIIWEKLTRCNYIKIDAEGAEQEIIEGAKQIIATYRPIIQAEVSISDFKVSLDNYSVFQAKKESGSLSPNRMFIPNESQKIQVAKNLGLELIQSS